MRMTRPDIRARLRHDLLVLLLLTTAAAAVSSVVMILVEPWLPGRAPRAEAPDGNDRAVERMKAANPGVLCGNGHADDPLRLCAVPSDGRPYTVTDGVHTWTFDPAMQPRHDHTLDSSSYWDATGGDR